MKRLFQKILVKVFKRAVRKAVTNHDVVPDVEPVIPEEEPAGDGKKAVWFIIQTLISILTAILTALGATSCVSHF